MYSLKNEVKRQIYEICVSDQTWWSWWPWGRWTRRRQLTFQENALVIWSARRFKQVQCGLWRLDWNCKEKGLVARLFKRTESCSKFVLLDNWDEQLFISKFIHFTRTTWHFGRSTADIDKVARLRLRHFWHRAGLEPAVTFYGKPVGLRHHVCLKAPKNPVAMSGLCRCGFGFWVFLVFLLLGCWKISTFTGFLWPYIQTFL